MNKEALAKLGEQVLENTLKVIENLADDDTMVFLAKMLGKEVLTKNEIIQRFKTDDDFAFRLAEGLDKDVKEYLFRTKFRKKRRKKEG